MLITGICCLPCLLIPRSTISTGLDRFVLNTCCHLTENQIFSVITPDTTKHAPMNWLFPKETTRYITMLRDPTEQFESIFTFFGLGRFFQELPNDASPLEHFLQNATFYSEQFKRRSRLLNLIKNPALFDLGLDTAYHEDFTVVRNYIRFLQQEFDLVMVMEYFDESLVLLKRRFCWKIEDILYFKLNKRIEAQKQKLSKFAK